jgi:hypothetical protein
MDCNQVFMILTRGPFPTGEPWDEQVEAHLETCAECWQLAEALRPALEVFQEAVPPAESRNLPGYWGDARPAASVVAELREAASQTALASGVRQKRRPYSDYRSGRSVPRISADMLRAIVLTGSLTAIAVGLAWLWRS